MLVNEYKIQSFDVFVAQIHKHFMEACVYEFTNRISNLKDPNYGKPKTTKPGLQLSEDTIMKSLSFLITNAINFYLPEKDEQLNPLAKPETLASLDDVQKILQTKEGDVKIDTSLPEKRNVYVEKPEVSDKTLEFKRKLKKELPVDLGPINPNLPTPIDDIQPIIKVPVEKENPSTGDITIYDDVVVRPFKPADETPIIVETPVGGGGGNSGGGGGGFVENDFGTGFGRERVVQGDLVDRQNIQ